MKHWKSDLVTALIVLLVGYGAYRISIVPDTVAPAPYKYEGREVGMLPR